ncbi:MAG: tetraacyldisaccharide 4'-kinase [Chthoniobacteraceae bacterium]
MRRWLEEFEQFAIEVILDRRHGKRATILRWLLYLFSFGYRFAVQTRIFFFRKRIFREHHMGCLVISIGNLTVGGTGKTPVVERFARALQAGGRRVAILSRGYKSRKLPLGKRIMARFRSPAEYKPRIVSDGNSVLLDSRMAGDEPYMLAKNLKNVIVLVDKNRVGSGLYAVNKMGCDTLLLDDGMQFLHVKHGLEIVLIDRQAPFGNEFLLPRGTLREPPENLVRASYIFITKSIVDGNEELIKRIRTYNRTAEIIECSHKPLHLEHAFTGETLPLEWLNGRYIGALSAIAAPESFEDALIKLGAKIEISKHFADHHRFSHADLNNFTTRCVRRDLAAIITTEKDSVRLPKFEKLEVPIYYLRVEIEILTGHESWQHLVDRICNPLPMMRPERFFG